MSSPKCSPVCSWLAFTTTRAHCWLEFNSLSTRNPRSFPTEQQPSQLTLTYAATQAGSISCSPRAQGFLLLSFDSSEKLSHLTEHHTETTLPWTSLTCGAGTLLTGPSSNIGGGGGGGGEGGEGKASSGAGGKGSSKGGGGGGNAQFEEKLASSPGGGGGGSGRSIGKNENKSYFRSFLTASQESS